MLAILIQLFLFLLLSIFDQREMHMSFTMGRFTITVGIMAGSLSDTISYHKKRKVRYTHTHAQSADTRAMHVIYIFRLLFILFKLGLASVHLPSVATSGDHFLYTTKYNYVDLNADDNGIWAIYTTAHSSHTNVVKVRVRTQFAIWPSYMRSIQFSSFSFLICFRS